LISYQFGRRNVAKFLSLHPPQCPVILHTSNFDGRLAMQNRLRAGGWTVATAPPREADWIQASWLPIARRLIGLLPVGVCCMNLG